MPHLAFVAKRFSQHTMQFRLDLYFLFLCVQPRSRINLSFFLSDDCRGANASTIYYVLVLKWNTSQGWSLLAMDPNASIWNRWRNKFIHQRSLSVPSMEWS